MPSRREHREQCRTLADRLIVEYAGALPPGQVLAAVFRVDRDLMRHHALSSSTRLAMCDSVVRRLLTDRLAGRRDVVAA